jgi:hypothetical protein
MTTSRPGESARGHAAEPDVSSDPQALEREIARTREQLGETVGELIGKTDVKARVRAKTTELTPKPLRQVVARSTGTAKRRPVPLAAAAAGSLLIAGYLVIRRWRVNR